MKKVFKDFANYVKLFDGYGKPRINFQEMYKLFPNFEFIAASDFGQYRNFNAAYEHKIYNMTVKAASGEECYLNYREYYDTIENAAYCS